MDPALDIPTGGLKQIGRRLPDVTTSSDQNSWHDWNTVEKANFDSPTLRPARCKVAALLRRRDFNFFKSVFLDRPDLLEADQLQQREKRYDDLDPRCSGAKQIRKTEGGATRDAM